MYPAVSVIIPVYNGEKYLFKRAWIFYGRNGSNHCGNTWSQSSDGSDSSWKTALYCGQKLQKLFFL